VVVVACTPTKYNEAVRKLANFFNVLTSSFTLRTSQLAPTVAADGLASLNLSVRYVHCTANVPVGGHGCSLWGGGVNKLFFREFKKQQFSVFKLINIEKNSYEENYFEDKNL
jgi:hypothetical protein